MTLLWTEMTTGSTLDDKEQFLFIGSLENTENIRILYSEDNVLVHIQPDMELTSALRRAKFS